MFIEKICPQYFTLKKSVLNYFYLIQNKLNVKKIAIVTFVCS